MRTILSKSKRRIIKRLSFLLALLVFMVIAILLITDQLLPTKSSNTQFGVTFSPEYAEDLHLNWQETYLKVLDDLKVRLLRLPTYWEEVEPQMGVYNFTDTDFLVNQAAIRGAKILLVVGYKQPRWPECHAPSWAAQLSPEQRRQQVLEMVKQVVERYKNNPAVWGWQVENEPFFGFGKDCDPLTYNQIRQEVDLVKSLDPGRPEVVTDTGEWSSWIRAMQLSDILGISVYNTAYNPVIGYTTYPLPVSFYLFKSKIVRSIFASTNQQTIISELQTEPWARTDLSITPITMQLKIYPLSDMQNNLILAQKTQFSQVYLWGVEWWYAMAQQGHPEYLNLARKLINH